MKQLNFMFDKYGNGLTILLLLLACFVIYYYYTYVSYNSGMEYLSSDINPAYSNTPGSMNGQSLSPMASTPGDTTDQYASATGIQSSIIQPSGSCTSKVIQNPAELLPKEDTTQWSTLNPSGKGELSNINLLKAGFHTGIDTIGSSLRNANLQLRSEPANPQIYSGPWNMTTITPDVVKPAFEIGSGSQ